MGRFRTMNDNLRASLKFKDGLLDPEEAKRLNNAYGTKTIQWKPTDKPYNVINKFDRRLISLAVLVNTSIRKKKDENEKKYRRLLDLMRAEAQLTEEDVLTVARSFPDTVEFEEERDEELDAFIDAFYYEYEDYDTDNLKHRYVKNQPAVKYMLHVLRLSKYKRPIIF